MKVNTISWNWFFIIDHGVPVSESIIFKLVFRTTQNRFYRHVILIKKGHTKKRQTKASDRDIFLNKILK